MNYEKRFEKENMKFISEYRKLMEEVKNINEDSCLEGDMKDYFYKTAEFIFKLDEITELVKQGKMDLLSLDELKNLNTKLYDDIIDENYDKSFANPEYAVNVFGEELGKYLSLVYTKVRDLIESAYSYRIFDMVPSIELFTNIYIVLKNDDKSVEGIKEAILSNAYKYQQDEWNDKFNKLIDIKKSYLKDLVMESDLNDLRYLYKYDGRITKREIEIAEFFNSLTEAKVEAMAKTYTEGFERGYVTCNLDMSKKKYVNIYYSIGFERLARKAAEMFEAMGLEPIYSLYQPYYTNRQYKYDHRFDYAAYLSEEFAKSELECSEKAMKKYEEFLGKYAGPAAIETFGEKSFEPKNKKEAFSLSGEAREVDVKLKRELAVLRSKYMKSNEYSFTIIAYPTPEIGENFKEIFEETIKVNTLDNEVYGNIQQCIIDALDKGDYAHILGMGKNKTDLKVNLYKLNNPSKETIFENCRADVNIPVGEVFTSPVLKDTNGKLHVTEVFLNGLKYKDLEIDLKEGMIDSYNCNNFEKEEDNKKFIKENILFNHESLPIGEFAIGTNTTAYVMGQKYGIQDKLPILIAEKTGPHFAMGDTCYSMSEENRVYNPDGKEIVAKDNERSLLRKTDISKAYFNCHTDITIPYDELGEISVYTKSGEKIVIIKDGRFVLPGTEKLNEAFK